MQTVKSARWLALAGGIAAFVSAIPAHAQFGSTKQMRAFLDKIQPQDRVLVIGDTRQHQGVEGIEPSRPCGLRIFIPFRLSPPRQRRVRGLGGCSVGRAEHPSRHKEVGTALRTAASGGTCSEICR
jgi:hypothetical protein